MSPSTPAPSPRSAPRTLTARNPEDVLALVPVVLGFEPTHSVVMLTFGAQQSFHARVDLPPPGEPEALEGIVTVLLDPVRHHAVTRVLFVLYCDDGPAARLVRRRLVSRFTRAGVEVLETLRAHEGRWYAPGAPRHGVAYDVGDHPFRAQAVLDGLVLHGSREELAAALEPVAESVAATATAVRRAAPSPPDEVADLVGLRLDGGRFTTSELARVLLGLLDLTGRDAAWAAMTRDDAAAHVRLWTDAVQRSPDELAGAPAAVLGMAAWLAGHGALAWCAVDRARAVDPGNTLATLVADVLTRAVPPSVWPTAQAG